MALDATPAPLIDNARVSVWEVTLSRGETGPLLAHDRDTVVMVLEGGRIRTTSAGSRAKTETRRFGDAVFVPKGSDARQTLVGGGPAKLVIVALKGVDVPPAANTTGLPPAFPRPGSVKRLETPKLVVWRYQWKPGVATPMHFHDKEVVVAYRSDGALASTTPDGVRTLNRFKAGEVRFNAANRIHSELLESPQESAVMMELK